jgi:hypothetical protein
MLGSIGAQGSYGMLLQPTMTSGFFMKSSSHAPLAMFGDKETDEI